MLRFMTRAAILVAAGVPLLAGCTTGPDVPNAALSYAPYSESDSPACGAIGRCAPAAETPYPMHGDYGAY
jgi:hypothetical protein